MWLVLHGCMAGSNQLGLFEFLAGQLASCGTSVGCCHSGYEA